MYNKAKTTTEVKTMEKLISQIKSNINTEYSFENPVSVEKYRNLVYEKELTITAMNGEVSTTTCEIWTKAIQKALDENECVYIPNIGKRIFVDDSLIMHTNNKLKVDSEQVITLTPKTNVCMLKSDNILDGNNEYVTLKNPTCDIAVEGGIWDVLTYKNVSDAETIIKDGKVFKKDENADLLNGNMLLRFDKEHSIQGVFAIMLFSNVKNLIVKNMVMANSMSYGVQVCNCEGVFIENILFENYHKDGIHLNGPAKYVHINEMSGKNMGDDLVALNAWDWAISSMTNGTIEKTLVENIHSVHSELRLLPGRKVYDDGTKADCDIRDTVVRNVEGVYTFKMYAQPYFVDTSDCSETVGVLENVYLDSISFPEITGSGLGGIAVGGLFEVCADTNNVYFDNIKIENTVEDFKKVGIPIIKVGPLSETFKFGSEDPDEWREIMSPDDICTVENTHIGKIEFSDAVAAEKDKDLIIRATRQTINKDYPNTLPKGGTGYGIVNGVIFE